MQLHPGMRRITHIRWLDASDYAAAVVIADEDDAAGVPVEIDQLRARHGRPPPPPLRLSMRPAPRSLRRAGGAHGALALVRA